MRILGLRIDIPWAKFTPGTSFFIPCLDTKEVAEFVIREAKRRHYNVLCKQVLERGMYGLRCWRVE